MPVAGFVGWKSKRESAGFANCADCWRVVVGGTLWVCAEIDGKMNGNCDCPSGVFEGQSLLQDWNEPHTGTCIIDTSVNQASTKLTESRFCRKLVVDRQAESYIRRGQFRDRTSTRSQAAIANL